MSKKAGYGWLVIGVYVAAYDYWAIKYGHETLSGACWRALDTKAGKVGVFVGATMLYKHLVAPKVLPKADPFHHVAQRWHSKARV